MAHHAWLLGLGFLCMAGCASGTSDGGELGVADEEQELSSASLRSLTHVQTTLSEEGTIELAYAPGAGGYPATVIPFEAAELGADVKGDVEVEVSGDFPSNARLLIVNDQFRVLAQGRTARADGLRVQTEGTSTLGVGRLSIRDPQRGSKILIRDSRWDRPMNFNVKVDVRR